MPAHAKLTRKRERRAVTLIAGGATIAEASRAIQVSRSTVYRALRSDPFFADELRAARARTPSTDAAGDFDWREAAARLEAIDPARWRLPDPFGATARGSEWA